jgi:outer membrane protein assembly factor BamB
MTRSSIRRMQSLALCLLLSLVGLARAELSSDGLIASPEPGWPQWRGPRRDGVSDEKGLLQSWPQGGPKLLWKRDGLGKGWSSPIVVGERIYLTGDVGDDLVVFALNLDGTLVWQTKNGRSWKNPYPGARACCVYSDGRVYNLNAHGRLACLDAGTGKELWSVDILERFKGKNTRGP